MAILGPRANLWVSVALLSTAAVSVVLLLAIWVVPVMGYNTQDRYSPEQPVPFSHQHHVSGLGLDCRYCHTTVGDFAERRHAADRDLHDLPLADLDQCPDTGAGAAKLRRQRPLRWTEVYRLPDYVYFDHSIHIAKGVGCTECHGPIGDMALTWKATTLYMGWCLSCHRDPAPHLRPRDQVFNPHWKRTAIRLPAKS